MSQIILLLSGGIDSTVIAAQFARQKADVYPLFIDYGQRARQLEQKAAEAVCNSLNIRPPEIYKLSGHESIPSALLNEDLEFSTNTYLPQRNLLFLVLGTAFAEAKAISQLAIGTHSETEFPDQGDDFFAAAETALNAGSRNKIEVLRPLQGMSKRDVMTVAREIAAPIELTYSCHAGTPTPCGECIACREIANATT